MESLLSGVSFDYDIDIVNVDSGTTAAKSRVKNGSTSKNAAINSETASLKPRPGNGSSIDAATIPKEESDETK